MEDIYYFMFVMIIIFSLSCFLILEILFLIVQLFSIGNFISRIICVGSVCGIYIAV